MRESSTQRSSTVPTDEPEHLRFEGVLADLAARFVNLPAERVDQQILDAQQQLCECLGLQRSSLWQQPLDEPGELVLTHLHGPPLRAAVPPSMRASRFYPWILRRIFSGETFAIADTADLPPEAARDRETCEYYGIVSVLVLPLTTDGGKVIGALAFGATQRQRAWPEPTVTRCRLVAQVFAGALARRRSEQALCESRATLDAIIDSTSDFIWSVDSRSFGVMTFNRTMHDFVLQRLGVRLKQGMRPEDLHPDERTIRIWRGFYQRALAEGAFTAGYISSTDEPFVLQISFHVLTRDGEVFGISAFGKDITQQKRAEEKLRAAEAAQRALIDAVDDSLFLVTPDGTMPIVNGGLARHFGKTVRELTGTSTYDLLPRDVAERRRGYITQVVKSGQPLSVEDERGGRRIENRLFPVCNAQGDITHVAILGRDVTERRRTEMALRRYELLAAHTRDIILFIRSADSRIIDANEAAVIAYGYSLGELCGLTIEQLRAVEAKDHSPPLEEQANSDGIRFETIHRRRDGSTFAVEVSSRGMAIGPDRIVLTIIRDITERQRAEELSRQQQSQLAHLSRIASVGEMASGLAHELNQPLTTILNYATVCGDLMDRADSQPELMHQALHGLVEEARRAGEIIRRLRTFIGKQPPQRTPADIAVVVREGLGLMAFELRRAGIRPVEQFAAGLPQVCIDVVQIQQVLVNLVQNAIDAMAETQRRQRRLIVRVYCAEQALVHIEVEDSGYGLPTAVRDRVFEPFVTTKPNGLGLGLPISRSIVESHGGHLVHRANADRGTTFRFSLPAMGR